MCACVIAYMLVCVCVCVRARISVSACVNTRTRTSAYLNECVERITMTNVDKNCLSCQCILLPCIKYLSTHVKCGELLSY